MKKIVTACLIGIFSLSANFAHAENITVKVKGMVCSFCAQGIKKTFGKEDSVESVEVDLDMKIVQLKIKEGKALEDEKLRAIIIDAGYDVDSIERGKND